MARRCALNGIPLRDGVLADTDARDLVGRRVGESLSAPVVDFRHEHVGVAGDASLTRDGSVAETRLPPGPPDASVVCRAVRPLIVTFLGLSSWTPSSSSSPLLLARLKSTTA